MWKLFLSLLHTIPTIQTFNNFQYSKTMSSIFHRKKLVKSMSQGPNLGRLLCRSKFESLHKNPNVKNCVSCPYLLKASLYQLKRVIKTFLLKSSFKSESSNLIYVVICQGCKEEYIGETGCLVKEQEIFTYKIQDIRNIDKWQLKNIYALMKMESFVCFLFARLFKKISH